VTRAVQSDLSLAQPEQISKLTDLAAFYHLRAQTATMKFRMRTCITSMYQ
jgi:hypothetical protein